MNNLILWLHSCSLEQFSGFIAMVRETAGEGGQAHDQLAEVLQKNFEKFCSNHDVSGVCVHGSGINACTISE